MTGQEIRRIREALGVSQAEIARAIGKSQSLVFKIEAGQVRMTVRDRARATELARRLLGRR